MMKVQSAKFRASCSIFLSNQRVVIKVFILLMLFYLALLTLKRMLPMLTLRDVPSELDWL